MVGRPQRFSKKWSKVWCCDNAKLAGCSQGDSLNLAAVCWRVEIPYRLLSQFGSLNPLNSDAELQLTHLDGSGRRLVGPLHKVIDVSTHCNEEVEEPRDSMSAPIWLSPPVGLELTIYFHQASSPSAW